MDLPIKLVLAVVRQGAGAWDTRRIDVELGLRGVVIHRGILREMNALAEVGLIERVPFAQPSTGPCWRITQAGEELLETDEG